MMLRRIFCANSAWLGPEFALLLELEVVVHRDTSESGARAMLPLRRHSTARKHHYGSEMVDFLSLRQLQHTAHASARRFTCPLQCGYAGRDRTAMRVHQHSMHSTERPFVCFCSYAAKTKWALRVHQQCMHSTERPYVCFCSYAAKTKWALDTHRKRKHNT